MIQILRGSWLHRKNTNLKYSYNGWTFNVSSMALKKNTSCKLAAPHLQPNKWDLDDLIAYAPTTCLLAQPWGNHGTSKICKHMQSNIFIRQYCTTVHHIIPCSVSPSSPDGFELSDHLAETRFWWQGVRFRSSRYPLEKWILLGGFPYHTSFGMRSIKVDWNLWNVQWPLRLVWYHVVWIYLRDSSEIDLFHSFFSWTFKTKWMISSVKPENPILK